MCREGREKNSGCKRRQKRKSKECATGARARGRDGGVEKCVLREKSLSAVSSFGEFLLDIPVKVRCFEIARSLVRRVLHFRMSFVILSSFSTHENCSTATLCRRLSTDFYVLIFIYFFL